VSVQVVIKQIQREAAANKGKAAVLAAVCVVALYFWVPLVSGWFSGGAGDDDELLVVTPNAAAAPALANIPASAVAPAVHGEHAWYDVAHWMASDPLMASATLPAGLQDPFRQPAPKVEEPDADEVAKTPEPPARLDPEKMGMVLTSTMVGSHRAVIQISGKSLAMPIDANGRPTKTTTLWHTHGGTDYPFAVVAVQPGGVVLQHESETYNLRMKQPSSVGNGIVQFLSTKN
jgi:hypothetical protein